jgi:hypothetical protein
MVGGVAENRSGLPMTRYGPSVGCSPTFSRPPPVTYSSSAAWSRSNTGENGMLRAAQISAHSAVVRVGDSCSISS